MHGQPHIKSTLFWSVHTIGDRVTDLTTEGSAGTWQWLCDSKGARCVADRKVWCGIIADRKWQTQWTSQTRPCISGMTVYCYVAPQRTAIWIFSEPYSNESASHLTEKGSRVAQWVSCLGYVLDDKYWIPQPSRPFHRKQHPSWPSSPVQEIYTQTSQAHSLINFIILTAQSLFIIHLNTNKIALKFTLLKTTH